MCLFLLASALRMYCRVGKGEASEWCSLRGWGRRTGYRCRKLEESLCVNFWVMGRGWSRAWVWGRRWLTVVCMREPNLPPSAVRVEDVRPSKAPGHPPPLCLSLPLFTGNVMLSAHICLSAVEWGRVRGDDMGVGWRGHGQPPSFFCRCRHLSFCLCTADVPF